MSYRLLVMRFFKNNNTINPQPITYNPQPTIVSAPGKIHLLGEHAVVYGKPALLTAINRRLYVEIKRHSELIINSEEKNQKFVLQIIDIFKNIYRIVKLPPLEIKITSQIPIGSGMGSSAALSSALIGALMKELKGIWNPNKINEFAYEAEKIAHGNPSGADNTTIVFGGLVWFRKEFDFLKSIWSLPILSYKFPSFVFINSGKPLETTKEMVAKVGDLYNKTPKKTMELFNDQENLVKRLLLSFKTGDKEEMKKVIFQGERNLEKMGVVGRFAQKVIRKIEAHGGVAKICGAGGYKRGSGIILCYHKELQVVKKISGMFELESFPVKPGEEGIRIENKQIIQLSNNPIIQ